MFIWKDFYDMYAINPQAYYDFVYWLAELTIEKYNIKDGPRCLELIKKRIYEKHINPVMDNLLYASVYATDYATAYATGAAGLTTAANQIIKDFDLENLIRYKITIIENEINDTKLGRMLYA